MVEPSPIANHVASVETAHVEPVHIEPVHVVAAPAAVSSATVNPNKAAMAEKIAEYTKAGINPAAVFAFGKTGILVTAENSATLSAAEITAWEVAMNEYFAGHPGVKS